jgi:hypothetical protein
VKINLKLSLTFVIFFGFSLILGDGMVLIKKWNLI